MKVILAIVNHVRNSWGFALAFGIGCSDEWWLSFVYCMIFLMYQGRLANWLAFMGTDWLVNRQVFVWLWLSDLVGVPVDLIWSHVFYNIYLISSTSLSFSNCYQLTDLLGSTWAEIPRHAEHLKRLWDHFGIPEFHRRHAGAVTPWWTDNEGLETELIKRARPGCSLTWV